MRIFTFLTLLALSASLAQAAPVGMEIRHKAPVMKSDIEDQEVIYETPEGIETWLTRSCDGFRTEAFSAEHGPVLGSVMRMVETEDGEVYLSHIASEYPVDTWIKAVREGNTLIIEGVQPIYVEYDYDTEEELNVYVAPMHVQIDENGIGTFIVTDDQKFVFNIAEDGTLTSADPEMLLGVCVKSDDETVTGNDSWIWKGFGDRNITAAPFDLTPLEVPENLKTEDWVWKDEFESAFVSVAIDGDDFYINGMNRSLPDAWIKGKIDGDKVTFPSGQYMGADMNIYYYSFFCGAKFTMGVDEDDEPVKEWQLSDAAVFNYDPENKSISASAEDLGYVINSTADTLYPLYGYAGVTVGLQHRNPDTAPAAPYDLEYTESDFGNSVWFQLPNTDVDGNMLNEKKLFYEIYVDGALQEFAMTDDNGEEDTSSKIPYNYTDWMDIWIEGEDHTVYIYIPVEKSVAVRSIYLNENDVEIPSEMTVFDTSAVDSIPDNATVTGICLFNLQGIPVTRGYRGPVIKVTTYSDGAVTRQKQIRR